MRKLKRLDDTLKKLDFDVYFEITKVGVNVTGNPTDKYTGNHRIVEFGFKEQSTRLIKTNESFSVISFGLQMTTFYSILHVYRFFKSYYKAIRAYGKNFVVQTNPDLYVQFIKDVDAVKRGFPYYDREQRAAAMRTVAEIDNENSFA